MIGNGGVGDKGLTDPHPLLHDQELMTREGDPTGHLRGQYLQTPAVGRHQGAFPIGEVAGLLQEDPRFLGQVPFGLGSHQVGPTGMEDGHVTGAGLLDPLTAQAGLQIVQGDPVIVAEHRLPVGGLEDVLALALHHLQPDHVVDDGSGGHRAHVLVAQGRGPGRGDDVGTPIAVVEHLADADVVQTVDLGGDLEGEVLGESLLQDDDLVGPDRGRGGLNSTTSLEPGRSGESQHVQEHVVQPGRITWERREAVEHLLTELVGLHRPPGMQQPKRFGRATRGQLVERSPLVARAVRALIPGTGQYGIDDEHGVVVASRRRSVFG